MTEVKDTKAIQRALRGNLESAMRIMVEDLASRAAKDAPIEEGTLRASAHPSVEVKGGEILGRVTFSMPYAQVQHEDLTFVHPKGGKAKYLEGNMTTMAPRYMDAMAKAAKRAIDHG